MKLYCYCWLFFMACTFNTFAQQGINENSSTQYFTDGIVLYQKGKYLSALQKFNFFLSTHSSNDKKVEALYYTTVCDLHLNHPSAQKQLVDFISEYPYHSITQKAHIEIGTYFFKQKKYTDALIHLEKVAISDDRDEQILEVKFEKAYCYLVTEQPDKAKLIFTQIKKGGNYAAISNYYTALFAYKEGDFHSALKDLEVASKDKTLMADCYPLILHIYHLKKDYDKVIKISNELNQNDIQYPKNLNALIADSYFEKKNYEKAIIFFERSFNEEFDDKPLFHFRLGFSYLQLSEYEKAATSLNKVLLNPNNLTQSAYYYLGIAYSFQKKYLQAIVAFNKASKLNNNSELQENCAFLELKLLYDTRNFEMVIKKTDSFFFQYPKSKYQEELDHLYVSALQNTDAHFVALAHIANMKEKKLSPQLKNVYQSMAYQSAVGNYNDENYDLAITMLKKSLIYNLDQELTNNAFYWLAEIYQLQNLSDSAVFYFNKVNKKSKLYLDALYGLGYVYYNKREKVKGKSNFRYAYLYFDKYAKYGNRSSSKYGDSYFLKGNCLLVLGNYHEAIVAFDSALRYYNDKNLVYLQKALAYVNNLESQKAEKSLNNLIYNNSSNKSHRDFAYFELGLIYYKKREYNEAKKWFEKLLKEYPSFENLAETRHKLGFSKQQIAKRLMIASNYKNGDRYPDEYYSAIIDYQLLIQGFVHTSYAKNAFKAITNIHNNEFKIEGYDTLKRYFQLNNPEIDFWEEQDFNDAIRFFEKRDFNTAIQRLIAFKIKYPKSKRLNQTHYNIGYCFQNIEDKTVNYKEAIKNFDLVEIGSYKIKAMRNAASLELKLNNYSETLIRYQRLLKSTTEDKHLITAYLGLMEAYFQTNDYQNTIGFANKALKSILYNNANKLKAYFYKGKALMQEQNYNEAIAMFNTTLSITSKMAAEAQYLIGEIYYKKKEYDQSIDALLIVTKLYGDYREWQEKSYLLMGENQINLGQTDAAIATLNSIFENGTIPEIKNKAQELLNNITLNENNIAE